jgi:SRSO17 transposase
MEHLAAGLGHADRHAGLKGYCTGLMLPIQRKSVEPLAAHVDPLHVQAKHLWGANSQILAHGMFSVQSCAGCQG